MLCVAVGGCCREEGVSKDFLGADEKDHRKGAVHPGREKSTRGSKLVAELLSRGDPEPSV